MTAVKFLRLANDQLTLNNFIGGTVDMVSYRPLWETMSAKGVTAYKLQKEHGFSAQTINNLRHNKGITTFTLEKLCKILECGPEKVIEFI